MPRTKLLVVDDHPLFRKGVVDILSTQEGFMVVGEASDGREAVEKALALLPDVITLDLEMPNMGGLEAAQALQAQLPDVKILMLTVSEKANDLQGSIRAGARGYLLKNATSAELIRAVAQIAQGGVIVSPLMADMLLRELTAQPEKLAPGETELETALSPRETEVLQQVARGASNKEIATRLFISENTVKTHLRNIMEKLHFANRSQAAAYGARLGLDRREPS